MEDLIARSGNPLTIAATYMGLGEPENSLKWLEKCTQDRVPQMIWILNHPVFEPVRGDSRFQSIREKMNLLLETDSPLPK